MPKYVCSDEYDGFYTTSESLAIEHIQDNPGHQLVMIEHDPVTGHLRAEIIEAKEEYLR